jgi:hypothetical protein
MTSRRLRSSEPVLSTESSRTQYGRGTAALRDFEAVYVADGSILRMLPTQLPRQKSLRLLPELPKGRNSPSVP